MCSRYLAPLSLFLLLSASAPLIATAPVPRKSPELKFLDPSGQQKLLSNFSGKVVMVEFLLVKCPHCLRVAQTINKLNAELGPRGFQPIGIAFDNGINGPLVKNFTEHFKVGYPIGYTSSDQVDGYLGRAGTERFGVPQIVVIDRKGIIRAQSRPTRETNLENEEYLRNLIESLLKERAPVTGAKHAAPSKKTG